MRRGPQVRHKGAMNQLNVSLQHSILTLAGHGWSARRIARQLDLNRETVGKYLRLARSKPAISTAGSPPDSFSKPAISTLGSADVPAAEPAIPTPGCWRTATPGRPSCCQPFAQHIEAAAAVGLSAQRIYQDLVSEHGFTGSYQAVKRFVRQWRQTQPTPFIRMACRGRLWTGDCVQRCCRTNHLNSRPATLKR